MNDEITTSVIPYEFAEGDDGFALVATPTTATFRAPYMDFKQGEYLLGPEREVVPLGTKFIVHAATEGWVRLESGEAPQRIAREPGKPFPQRSELGDTDKSLWPVYNDKPSDPWMLQYELLLTELETGRPVILRAKSWSARDVVADLCRMVTFQRRRRGPGAKPIIAIGAATRPHRLGSYKVPRFDIGDDWVGAEAVPDPEPSQVTKDLSERLQQSSVFSGKEKSTAAKPRPQRRKPTSPSQKNDDDLNDEIPW
jgi:hypothetical protein